MCGLQFLLTHRWMEQLLTHTSILSTVATSLLARQLNGLRTRGRTIKVICLNHSEDFFVIKGFSYRSCTCRWRGISSQTITLLSRAEGDGIKSLLSTLQILHAFIPVKWIHVILQLYWREDFSRLDFCLWGKRPVNISFPLKIPLFYWLLITMYLLRELPTALTHPSDTLHTETRFEFHTS